MVLFTKYSIPHIRFSLGFVRALDRSTEHLLICKKVARRWTIRLALARAVSRIVRCDIYFGVLAQHLLIYTPSSCIRWTRPAVPRTMRELDLHPDASYLSTSGQPADLFFGGYTEFPYSRSGQLGL